MEEREEETVFSIWVNWERRVISFTQENGFEKLSFPTHEEKFKFAIDRGTEGFGIFAKLIFSSIAHLLSTSTGFQILQFLDQWRT